MTTILEAISMLQPYDIDKRKIRLGPNEDGGYVFVDDFDPSQGVVSYGIGNEYRLDLEFAERNHEVYMFDHTVELSPAHPRMHFFREGVAGQTDEANRLYSIADHLRRHRVEGDRLILKMDVEGAEYDAIIAAPDETLDRFEQFVLELHSLDLLSEPYHRERFAKMMGRLNSRFTLFHVHANNFDGPDRLAVVGGLPVPVHIELSYVRSTSVVRRPSTTLYPTPLDYPNNGGRDELLWFFPFLPSGVSSDELARSAAQAGLQA